MRDIMYNRMHNSVCCSVDMIVERIRPPKRANAAFLSTSMKLGTIVLWDASKLFDSNTKKFRALIVLN